MSEALYTQNPEDVIDAVRPNHESIKWFNGGDNRDVIVVDGVEAFRFPKDESGVEVGRFEFEAVKLVQGKLHVAVPKPIELAPDGSYNVLEFLEGKVLSKQAVTELPYDVRRDMGVAIAGVINDLNTNITPEEVTAIPSKRPFIRNRDDYYAGVYQAALEQEGVYADTYRKIYQRLLQMRPDGSASNIIVFGDFSSPNLVLADDYHLTGLIDWTELGIGDIHNELRPVFSVIGQEAFDEMVDAIAPKLGPVNKELVRTLAIIHELSVLISGKQKGSLTQERTRLAVNSLNQWLDEDLAS
ncbi:MAG TPA: aminoglycoside phosphotransferase family protein [Candidatus Saccharimonadales bacterium]|jgi:aminoglycoside phosphotransferase (APT) family kinase protein|nr:aminoglycoside phosphotransferase family protein [Candidatus Saccharimonadales bacterium]